VLCLARGQFGAAAAETIDCCALIALSTNYGCYCGVHLHALRPLLLEINCVDSRNEFMDAESVDALVLCHAFQLIECKNSSHKFQL
jgi:hypothetical protein